MTTSDTLGATARQAMIDIFRKKDVTAVDRYFAESFMQHDPNLADGLAGMKSFAMEIASSPSADITIYRTLVDGDFVLLHSRYEGVGRYGAPAIAFDLFRLNDGKIVEHWGGQEPEAPPNPSGRTQVDGPAEIVDREKTEINRALVRKYRETVMVSLRFDRIEEFIDSVRYAQHASKIGDGIAQLRERIASVAKKGGRLYLTPRRFVAEGNFVFVLTEGDLPSGTYCPLRSVSNREWKNSRALGCFDAYTSAGSVEKLKWTILGSRVAVKASIARAQYSLIDLLLTRRADRFCHQADVDIQALLRHAHLRCAQRQRDQQSIERLSVFDGSCAQIDHTGACALLRACTARAEQCSARNAIL